MPVHLEWIESASEQDWIDLNKLYKDAPVQWCEDQGASRAQSYVAQKQQQGYKIAAGRFNDRLIVAAALKVNTQKVNAYFLDDMCVRALTRERGVAKQLMVRLCQWSDEQRCSLWVEDSDAKLKVLLEFGFVHDQGKWFRQG